MRVATLEVVHVYRPHHPSIADDLARLPLGLGGPLGGAQVERAARSDDAASAQRQVEAELRDFIASTLIDTTTVLPTAVAIPSDQPADALVSAAADADLLVIGTRGHGSLTGILLGSVAHQAIQHAACPVLILPPEGD